MVRIFIVLTAFMFENKMPVRTIPIATHDCLALLFYASVPSFHSVCPSCKIPIFGTGISPIIDRFISITITVLSKFRPAFQKMLTDSERETSWDIVLVYAIDRFGRNSIEIAINKQKLINNGKTLISATQRTSTNIDGSKNLDGILLENMYIGLAEYYSAELSQKIRRGLMESREKGLFCGGGLTYGYNVVNKHIVINDEQAEIIRYIFQEYNNGKIIPDIINELNAKGYTYKGGDFVKNSLYRILRNEKYIGITKYMGVEYKNIYPPIISENLFYSIQKRLALYRQNHRRS